MTGGGGGAPKRNVKNITDPTIKKSEFFFTQPQISKPLAKNFTN
jgi:hypothetical protein